MRQVYREALPVLSSKQKWETVLSGSGAGMADVARAVRKRCW